MHFVKEKESIESKKYDFIRSSTNPALVAPVTLLLDVPRWEIAEYIYIFSMCYQWPGTNLHQFECAWWALGASNPPNTAQDAYFWVISGQIFPNFGNLKHKNASWEGCGIVWDIVPVARNHLGPT